MRSDDFDECASKFDGLSVGEAVVGSEVIVAPAGSFIYGLRDVPHTFFITSEPEARFLMVTEPGAFADFVRETSEPARAFTLPSASVQQPPPEG